MNVLLDSVILIDHFNGHESATNYIRSVRSTAVISVITRAEILTGFDDAGAVKARQLLELFHILPIDVETADEAARLRREHRWKLPDALQAALAQLNKLHLATRNIRDFPPERFPFVVVPYSLPAQS